MGLLRLNKDATRTKLSLALFTETLADNEDLGARVAHLEAEMAGVALSGRRYDEALHALVAAAAAYQVLGNLVAARSCLQRADSLPAGDEETKALLSAALGDLSKALDKPATPAPKPVPKPVPKPAPKPEAPAAEEKAPEKTTKKAPKKSKKADPLP